MVDLFPLIAQLDVKLNGNVENKEGNEDQPAKKARLGVCTTCLEQLSLWMEFRCENLAFMPFQLHYGCLQV